MGKDVSPAMIAAVRRHPNDIFIKTLNFMVRVFVCASCVCALFSFIACTCVCYAAFVLSVPGLIVGG